MGYDSLADRTAVDYAMPGEPTGVGYDVRCPLSPSQHRSALIAAPLQSPPDPAGVDYATATRPDAADYDSPHDPPGGIYAAPSAGASGDGGDRPARSGRALPLPPGADPTLASKYDSPASPAASYAEPVTPSSSTLSNAYQSLDAGSAAYETPGALAEDAPPSRRRRSLPTTPGAYETPEPDARVLQLGGNGGAGANAERLDLEGLGDALLWSEAAVSSATLESALFEAKLGVGSFCLRKSATADNTAVLTVLKPKGLVIKYRIQMPDGPRARCVLLDTRKGAPIPFTGLEECLSALQGPDGDAVLGRRLGRCVPFVEDA